MNRTPRGRLASRCVSARLYCLTVFGRSLRWSLRNLSTATLIGVRPAFVWSWYSATVSPWAAAWVAKGHAISVFLGLLRSIEGLTPAPLALCVCEANMELRALRRAAFSNPLILPSMGAFEPCVDAGHAGHHPK